ncbi:MAG: twin-arginine translocase subunit TatC [Alphaproteobacteria bacterium]|nr:twin-arginine translocase subunit TatC [Alphaproteobacteria bacterium]MCB9690379.1 twin-arginine translocase subunit TatC [Alphaproteobacteria bacterium]
MSEQDELEASRMPLLDHLKELRDRLVRSAIGLALGMVVSIVFVQDLIVELRRPFDEGCIEAERQLREAGYLKEGARFVCELGIVSSPFEAMYTWLWTAFLAGMMFAMPVIAFQLWQFIAPGLLKSERRMVYPLTFGSTVLFAMGAAFCFYVLLPFAMPMFFTIIPNLATNLSIRGYLSGIATMMLAFGTCFQLPVVVWFLARLGLIDHRDMLTGFRYAVVVIFIVAALLTPPDPVTQTALAIPLIVLYGLGIGVAWMSSTKERLPG